MFEDQIQRDCDRASKLMRGLARECYEASESYDQSNFRFETIGVVSVVVWEDEEGDAREDVAFAFETKRHHVKTGILQDTLAVHLKRSED